MDTTNQNPTPAAGEALTAEQQAAVNQGAAENPNVGAGTLGAANTLGGQLGAASSNAAPSITVTSGVDAGAQNDQSGTAADSPLTTEKHIDAVAQEVRAAIVDKPADDISAEIDLLGAIKGYRLAGEKRFQELLTGMANSTAEALRCLAEAEIHLADHIAQKEKAAAVNATAGV